MSLFYRHFNDFSPLFRLANELDSATRNSPHQAGTRSFIPCFDIKETQVAYELNGELPGIEQSNINIEWTDDNTLIISGHTGTSHDSNSPTGTDINDGSTANYQKPTVEEEGENLNKDAVSQTFSNDEVASDSHTPRYWITERSTGSFSRSFQFPTRVEHDTVKASLKNGILHLNVPKAKARQPRKISIQ